MEDIILTTADWEYANRHSLTEADMRSFILEMRIADMNERASIREEECRRAEIEATPQYQVYDAW